MVRSRTAPRTRSRSRDVLPKPAGVIHPRVQAAGPEHFGIVAVDCAKARFKWQLADFYGNVLVPPTTVEHNRPDLDNAVDTLRRVAAQHGLTDLIVAVERTGRYHHIPQRAFAAAGYDVRTVHPHAPKHYRQPSTPASRPTTTTLPPSMPPLWPASPSSNPPSIPFPGPFNSSFATAATLSRRHLSSDRWQQSGRRPASIPARRE